MESDSGAPALDERLIVVEEGEPHQNLARMRIVPTGDRLFENRGCFVVQQVRGVLESHT